MAFAQLALLFLLPGVVLIVSGKLAGRRPATWSPPSAKVEDGRAFQESTPEHRPGTGGARVVFGVILVCVGAIFGFLWYALRDMPALKSFGVMPAADHAPSVANIDAVIWLGPTDSPCETVTP